MNLFALHIVGIYVCIVCGWIVVFNYSVYTDLLEDVLNGQCLPVYTYIQGIAYKIIIHLLFHCCDLLVMTNYDVPC